MSSSTADTGGQVASALRSLAGIVKSFALAAGVYLSFDQASQLLQFFEAIVMFYRDLGAKLYNTIGLPNSILLGDASKGALTFRDVVTLTLVSLLITGVTVVGRSRQAQANLRRLSAAGPAVAAVSTSSGGGVGSGALIGLILAGPIGALIGAALGAASEKSETNDAYESALAEARYAVSSNSLMRRAFERFMFCMLVGSLIIAIHLNHTLLEALFRSINEAIQTFSRDGMSGIRQVLGLPVR